MIHANRRKRRLRFVILVCFGLLGSMMSAVLLSDPRVAAQVEAMATSLGERLSGEETAASSEQDPVAAPEATGGKPAVRYMPTSRIPVRRAAGDIPG